MNMLTEYIEMILQRRNFVIVETEVHTHFS